DVLRAHAVRLPLTRSWDDLCDTCGTGGDGAGTVNVSTLAALVAAGAGVRVAKHGNRAASSRCGSADLLEAMGVNLEASPEQVARCIEEAGFGFCFAPKFHPAMRAVAGARRALGIRTIFNLIGPLANPAPIAFQLAGVPEARLAEPMAEALSRLGIRHGLIVHGSDGLDEVTTTGPSTILEVRGGRVERRTCDPAELGIPPARPEALRGGDPATNARMAAGVLDGVRSPVRDLIILNAAWALVAAEKTADVREALAQAAESVDSGKAKRILERVRELTR
ncbi:MAG TPA: anthranilate phosphoribosyltransferase, partial [bacterium]